MLLPASGIRAGGAWQTRVYRLSGGRLWGKFARKPVLILTTRGRQSGLPRATPVLYLTRGGDIVVVGSNAGNDKPPAWALNLLAAPEAEVEIGRARKPVTARVAEGAERDELWRAAQGYYQGFDAYRARTDRDIKVFVLEARDAADESAWTSA